MVKFEPLFEETVYHPPGAKDVALSHPYYGKHKPICLALFNDHRFSFFYWALWCKKNGETPADLITLDWHQDLHMPYITEELKTLDLDNTFEVSFLSWARLSHLNDDHIKAAMYCNIIGNAYVICKQDMKFKHGAEDEFVEDAFGNQHICKKFNNTDEAYNYLKKTDTANVLFDIDLDYFTIDNESNGADRPPTFVKESEIIRMLDPNSDFIYWIFQRMNGFTIAFEPNFVGGFSKAMRLYGVIERTLFTGSVLNNDTEWKHWAL